VAIIGAQYRVWIAVWDKSGNVCVLQNPAWPFCHGKWAEVANLSKNGRLRGSASITDVVDAISVSELYR